MCIIFLREIAQPDAFEYYQIYYKLYDKLLQNLDGITVSWEWNLIKCLETIWIDRSEN